MNISIDVSSIALANDQSYLSVAPGSKGNYSIDRQRFKSKKQKKEELENSMVMTNQQSRLLLFEK